MLPIRRQTRIACSDGSMGSTRAQPTTNLTSKRTTFGQSRIGIWFLACVAIVLLVYFVASEQVSHSTPNKSESKSLKQPWVEPVTPWIDVATAVQGKHYCKGLIALMNSTFFHHSIYAPQAHQNRINATLFYQQKLQRYLEEKKQAGEEVDVQPGQEFSLFDIQPYQLQAVQRSGRPVRFHVVVPIGMLQEPLEALLRLLFIKKYDLPHESINVIGFDDVEANKSITVFHGRYDSQLQLFTE